MVAPLPHLLQATRRLSPPWANGVSDSIGYLLAAFINVRSGTLKTVPLRTDRCSRVSAIGLPLSPLLWHLKPSQDGRYTRSESPIALIASLLLTRTDTTFHGEMSRVNHGHALW